MMKYTPRLTAAEWMRGRYTSLEYKSYHHSPYPRTSIPKTKIISTQILPEICPKSFQQISIRFEKALYRAIVTSRLKRGKTATPTAMHREQISRGELDLLDSRKNEIAEWASSNAHNYGHLDQSVTVGSFNHSYVDNSVNNSINNSVRNTTTNNYCMFAPYSMVSGMANFDI